MGNSGLFVDSAIRTGGAPPEILLITRADGTPGEPLGPRGAFTRSAWLVKPNVLGIARNPGRVILPAVGDARRIEFVQVGFEPPTGFSIDEAGNIVVDDDPRKVGYYWYGRSGAVHLFLTVHGGNTHAMAYGPGLRLGLSSEREGPVLRELDASAVDAGGCATDTLRSMPLTARKPNKVAAQAATTAGSPESATSQSTAVPKHTARIGVLIYYTNAALSLYAGDANPDDLGQLQTTATAKIDELNQSLANSGDPYYVRFAQVGPAVNLPGYDESPGVTDPFQRFRTHLDTLRGYELADNAPRRATVGADFAILLVEDDGDPNAIPPRPVWGVANPQRNNCIGDKLCDVGDGTYPVPGFSYRNYAFGVVSIASQAQNLTFAHEVGHMLGSNHDPNVEYPVSGLPAAFTFSYGFRAPAVARDIMADPRCIDTNGDSVPDQCTERQPQFANPRAVFIGTSTNSGTANLNDVARTVGCLAEPSGNLYPFGESQIAPNLFWSGFEAPGLSVSTCPARVLWP